MTDKDPYAFVRLARAMSSDPTRSADKDPDAFGRLSAAAYRKNFADAMRRKAKLLAKSDPTRAANMLLDAEDFESGKT